jgi:hypothetical protein
VFSVRNEREPQMTGSTRVAYPTVAICVALLVGGCGGGQGASGTSPTASSAASIAPSPTGRPLRDTGGTAILDPGTYVLDYFPVDLAFDIPDGDPPGWHVGKSTDDAAVVLWYTPPDITYLFAFWNVDNVYADPCDAAAGELEPPIGPSVDDLVAALSNLPEFRATAPVDITVGAFRGKQIELTALDSGGDCPGVIVWSAGEESIDLSPGETRHVHVLDVDGVRIAMLTSEPAQRDAAVEAELHQILDSIRIEPLP